MSLAWKLAQLILLVACCGCGRLSNPPPVTYQITATSLPTSTTTSVKRASESPLQFVGRNSCSATACHGQPQAEPVTWRNAYPIWEATDPHRRAFDVLYTERSVKMFRKLTETAATSIDDAEYLRFVEEKCIGCHATPPAGSLVGGKLQYQLSSDAYWQGVSCESCHGAASNWLGQHYSLAWPESHSDSRVARTSQTGFHDMRSLEQRAANCLDCHQGPQLIGEQLYDVNHDLIAAGHPRLTFELHAYLANLPKHWDEAAEITRYTKAKPNDQQVSTFHFDTWRAGQSQQAQHAQLLQQARMKLTADQQAGEWAEFASKDCRHCHHNFGDVSYRLVGQTTQSLAEILQQPATTIAKRARLLEQLLGNSRTNDQAIEIYLAAAAFAADLPAGNLQSELTMLRESLAQQAGASQYDLPGRFDPQRADLQQSLTTLQQALQRLSP